MPAGAGSSISKSVEEKTDSPEPEAQNVRWYDEGADYGEEIRGNTGQRFQPYHSHRPTGFIGGLPINLKEVA